MKDKIVLETTKDGILNHRVTLHQPKNGFRAAVDTVLLAAACPIRAGESLCDFGCGVGSAMLAVAARVTNINALGLEIQPELVALAQQNINENSCATDCSVEVADVTQWQIERQFWHVIINPPYHDESSHDVSDNSIKRTANSAKDGDLALWLQKAAQVLEENGTLTLIHRADKMDDILTALPPEFTFVEILNILPKASSPAKRVLVRAYKKEHSERQKTICAPLILHNDGGRFSHAAEDILRHAKSILF